MMERMGATTAEPLTLEKFGQIEFGADEVELLRGELIRMPPPVARHMKICERVYLQLRSAVERCRQENPRLAIGIAHIEMGYAMSGDPHSWLRPDVSLTHPDQPGEPYYIGAPMMVFEVVSGSDTARDLDIKVAEYLDRGAAEVWLMYPDERHAWVYKRGETTANLETESITSPLLPGVRIPFSLIF